MGKSILTSLHGRIAGITHSGDMLSKGFVASVGDGNQIQFGGPRNVSFFDDFLGDIIADQYSVLEGTDSATTDASILSGGIGGVLRLTSGDAGTGLAADLVEVVTALQWQASNGGLVAQARVKLSRITNAYVFFGFTDSVSLEAPIVSAASADTFTTTASDAFGLMFDTRMSTDNWWATGVAADVDATHDDTGVAPVAAQYTTLRVEVTAAGKASFYIDGVLKSQLSGAVTPATDLTPVIALGNTSGTSALTLDVDYWHAAMDRAADGGAT